MFRVLSCQKAYSDHRMMPEKEEYGAWPRSGEIDIVEARGNTVDYPTGGRDTCSSTIHWGMLLSLFLFEDCSFGLRNGRRP